MTRRNLHVAAYDIGDPRRLRRALNILKGYATGGQKSVFECFLTPAEKRELIESMSEILDDSGDRFMVVRLPGKHAAKVLGRAVMPVDTEYFYIG